VLCVVLSSVYEWNGKWTETGPKCGDKENMMLESAAQKCTRMCGGGKCRTRNEKVENAGKRSTRDSCLSG